MLIDIAVRPASGPKDFSESFEAGTYDCHPKVVNFRNDNLVI